VTPQTRKVVVFDIAAGTDQVVSRGGADGPEADRPAGDASISDDGTRIAFVSAATNLDPAKPDDTRGVFVRDTKAGTTTLMSAASDTGVLPPPTPAVALPAGPKGAILIADNAFSRDHLTLPAGTALDFHWISTQSHNVTVVDGPAVFRATARNNHGSDFRQVLETPGRYTLVCTLHEPGMRLTLTVR
jgi:plastocyanin